MLLLHYIALYREVFVIFPSLILRGGVNCLEAFVVSCSFKNLSSVQTVFS